MIESHPWKDEEGAAPSAARKRAVLYASIDKEIQVFDLDLSNMMLSKLGSVEAIEAVQFAAADPERKYLFVATSNGGPGGKVGDKHYLVVYLRDERTGTLRLHGSPYPLPYRPIHLAVDKSGENVLVVFSRPAALHVYPVSKVGEIQLKARHASNVDPGIFPHQVRMTPSGLGALVCGRGNGATAEKTADIGTLSSFTYARGVLTPSGRIELSDGHGPRDLDFHPTLPLAYVALERGNKLAAYALRDDVLVTEPLFIENALADPQNVRPRQRVGTVRVHPNGKSAYLPNRADKTETTGGKQVFAGGENNIAVFLLAESTGAPTLVQHIDTRGIEARTMTIDPTGQWLIVANQTPMDVSEGSATRRVPVSLAFFRIAKDGRLIFSGKRDFEGPGDLIWSDVMELNQAGTHQDFTK